MSELFSLFGFMDLLLLLPSVISASLNKPEIVGKCQLHINLALKSKFPIFEFCWQTLEVWATTCNFFQKHVGKRAETVECELTEQSGVCEKAWEWGKSTCDGCDGRCWVKSCHQSSRASWRSARYVALIGPAAAVLFAAAQLWLVPPWKCMPYPQRKLGE